MKRDKRRKSIRAADQGERSSRVSSSRPRRRSARTQGGDTRRRGGGASKAQKVLLVANHSRRKHKGKTGTARNRNKKKGGFAKLGRNAEKGVCLSGKTHIPLLSLCRCLLFFFRCLSAIRRSEILVLHRNSPKVSFSFLARNTFDLRFFVNLSLGCHLQRSHLRP